MEREVVYCQVENQPVVSIAELNQIIRFCSGRSNVTCAIKMNNLVDRIDIAFIGGLYLLFKEQNIVFNVTGCGYRGDLFKEKTHLDELKQILSQLNTLYLCDPHWIRVAEIVTPDEVVFETPLFAPLLYISSKNLDNLFKKDGEGYYSVVIEQYIKNLNGNSNKLEETYFSEVTEDHIYSWLKENPPIYTFVYCILHTIGRPFIDKNSMEEVLDRIEVIKSFTVRYVAGLYELAKNIVWHSSTARGIISIGSYGIDGYKKRRIETYVMDYGTIGIVPTMIKELRSGSKEDEEDRQVLESGYTLEHFFKPGQSHRLLRQIRREMAHLGLIHFISLVRSNDGLCGISSNGVDGTQDFYGEGSIEGLPCIGTSFHFSLPLAKDTKLQGTKSGGLGMQATVDSLAAMPQIYQISSSIRNCSLSKLDVGSRDDEQFIVDTIPFNEDSYSFFAIDFINVTITATSLLRVFAMISERTDKGVIAYNLPTEVLSDLIMSNDTYFQQLKEVEVIPYWIKDRSILVYSYLEKDFYFADILYGDNPLAFKSINQIVNNTFPNYTTIASESIEEQLTDNSSDLPVSHFFQKSTLLPFDICLNNQEKKPLFYTNLLLLLTKPLMRI